MKFKSIIALTAILSFSALLFAEQPVTYTFSGFGGGLPSSATQTDPDKLSSSSSSSSASLLTTAIVGGVLIATGIVVVAVLTKTTNGQCYSDAANACADGFAEECGNNLADACTDSMIESCNSSAILF